MSSNDPKGMADRIVGWLRGLLGGGSTAGRGDASGSRDSGSAEARTELPDLDDSDSSFRYSGTAAGSEADQGTGDTGSEAAASASAPTYGDVREGVATDFGDVAEETDEPERSDFDDAAGDYVEDIAAFDTVSSDPDEAMHLHDAVGGRDQEADDTTDGIIDTTRQPNDPARMHLDAATASDADVPGASAQDEITAFEGASSDEFASGGYATTPIDQEDIAAASDAGYGADSGGERSTEVEAGSDAFGMSRGSGTSGDGDQVDYTEAQRDNYGLGDLGMTGEASQAAAPTTSETAAGVEKRASPATDEGEAFSSAGEDLAGTPAGTSAGEDLGGTAEASGLDHDIGGAADSDTGGAGAQTGAAGAPGGVSDLGDASPVDPDREALGTTLSYEDQSASAFDADAANLSAQDDLTIASEDRVTTFQSGTIAHEGLGFIGDTGASEQATDSYADLPDEPAPVDADDTGRDDFSGDDYPSDHRVDDSDSDAGWDAVTPDVDEAGSSAGDLDVVASGEDLLTPDTGAADTFGAVGDTGVDQDLVGTSDEHVGGEEPDFAEAASRGTDETGGSDLSGTSGISGDTAVSDDLAGVGVADAGPPAGTEPFASETADELGGMGVSDGDTTDELGGMGASDGDTPAGVGVVSGARTSESGDVPVGAVRGDGTTTTPEGYPIKGNSSSMIYHLPHFPSYANTKAEFCFATEDDAIAAGFRAPGRRNRGKSSATGDDAGSGTGASGPMGAGGDTETLAT